jgi:hypothetical protein
MLDRAGLAALLLSLALAIPSGVVSAQELTDDDCLACHADPGLVRADGSSVAVVDPEEYAASLHAGFGCATCHYELAGVVELPHAETLAPVLCSMCHDEAAVAYEQSIHAAARAEDEASTAASCVDCHGMHDILPSSDPASPTYHLNEPDTCGRCHTEPTRTYRDTFHGQVTALGFTPIAACVDCHNSHQILPASDERSSIAPSNLVSTCQTCHPDASEGFVEYDPHADKEDRARNPVLYYTHKFMKGLLMSVFGFFGLHTVLWGVGELRGRRRTGRRAGA